MIDRSRLSSRDKKLAREAMGPLFWLPKSKMKLHGFHMLSFDWRIRFCDRSVKFFMWFCVYKSGSSKMRQKYLRLCRTFFEAAISAKISAKSVICFQSQGFFPWIFLYFISQSWVWNQVPESIVIKLTRVKRLPRRT